MDMRVARGHVIGGKSVPAEAGETIPVLDPGDGAEFAAIARGRKSDVDAAVAAARAALTAPGAAPMPRACAPPHATSP